MEKSILERDPLTMPDARGSLVPGHVQSVGTAAGLDRRNRAGTISYVESLSLCIVTNVIGIVAE